MRISKFLVLVLTLGLFFFFSCDKQSKFTIEGTVKDGEGSMLYLEKRGLTNVSVVDSVKLDGDGRFSFELPTQDGPEFYLLKLGEQAINLSVDSTETISVKASRGNFAIDYEVEGSESSKKIKDVVLAQVELNKKLGSLKEQYNNKQLTGDAYLEAINKDFETYRDGIIKIIMSDLKSPAAYFALFQKLDDYLIFDPYNKKDSKLYSAVATSWDFTYKNNQRAQHLKNFTLHAIKQRRSEDRTASLIENMGEAKAMDLYNISLPDLSGKNIELSSLKGKVVLLDFTIYKAESSPLHNLTINKVYEKYKSKIEVYQVSFDTDLHFWENSAANLPWICVRDNQSLSSSLTHRFNIQELPTMYVIDKQGEIVKKLLVSDDIESEIAKLF